MIQNGRKRDSSLLLSSLEFKPTPQTRVQTGPGFLVKRSRPQAGFCGSEAGHSGSEAGPSSPGGGRASPEPLWTLNPGWGEESAEFPDGDDGAAFPVRDVGALLHVVEVEGALRSLAFRPAPISHKMS